MTYQEIINLMQHDLKIKYEASNNARQLTRCQDSIAKRIHAFDEAIRSCEIYQQYLVDYNNFISSMVKAGKSYNDTYIIS